MVTRAGPMTLSPEAQAAVDADRAAMRARAERGVDHRSRFGARSIGDFRLVEPGCEVWGRTDGDVANIRRREDDAIGGIVIDVLDEVTDPETGELGRAFHIFNYSEPVIPKAFRFLTEAQVDPDSFAPPQLGRIRGAYRRICRWVGEQRGNAGGLEVDAVAAAARLAAIVGQRRP